MSTETIKINETPAITVRELLQFAGQSKVYTILATATVPEMARALRDHKIGALAVIDAENHFMGTVSERDAVWKVLAEDKLPSSVTVGQIMTPASETITASLDDDIFELMMIYKDNNYRFRHIPTSHDGEVDGFVSERDVFKYLFEQILKAREK